MQNAMTLKTHRKLPVFDTMHDIYAFVFREFGTIVRLSWFPLLLSGIAEYFATQTAAVIASKLLAIAVWAVIAAALHRVILFGDRQPRTFLNLHFGKVEALFALPPMLLFLTLIVLEFLGVSLQWHFDGEPAFIFFFVMAVVIFFLGRFCLVFPIAVIERRFDFARAWALSHGNVWRMIAVWIVVTTPPSVIVAALLWLLLTGLTSLLEFVLLTYPTSIVMGALCVGILSYTYKALAGFDPDAVLKST